MKNRETERKRREREKQRGEKESGKGGPQIERERARWSEEDGK